MAQCVATEWADAGFSYWYQNFTNTNQQAVCQWSSDTPWLLDMGTQMEYNIGLGCQWLAFTMAIFNLSFYGFHAWKATTGWEEVYVCCVELVKVCLEISHENDSPATLYLSTGRTVLWIRFGEWLLSCPVILIHLSNITGLKDDYNKRTMLILISDLGCITMGVTAALCQGPYKWIFFMIGLLYGSSTYFNASKVYIEGFHMVPKGVCRNLVRAMAWCFYVAWTMFPLLFAFGPEGFGIMSRYGSNIGHTIADMLSKQIWGMLGHMLRVKIHEHIIIHGHLTVTTKVNVAGIEVETETMVEKDEAEDAVDHGTKNLANRESFLIMRDRMKQQGVDVRATFDDNDVGNIGRAGAAPTAAVGGMLEPGRVILAVPDISMVDFFRQQFAHLPAHIELVPALGADNTVALVGQAMQLGGLDCVLLHPEFLRDRSANGLVARLKGSNQRVIAFGWAPIGPMRDLIESSGCDGYLEGPAFGTPINQQQLVAVLCRVQQLRKMMANTMAMGGMGMMGGMMGMNPMMGGMVQMGNMAAPAGMMGANPLFAANGMGTPNATSLYGGMMNPAPAAPALGTPTGTTPGTQTPSGRPAAAAAGSEAEMLQQLMSEINRLKSELGEH